MLRRITTWLAPVAAFTALLLLATASGASADQWFKTDTHVHSSAVSGDAPQDIGIISTQARALGFNAIFLTDHTMAGTRPIARVISNHLRFDDDITTWEQGDYPVTGSAG